ncbi:MAG: hypothetical protein JNK23_10670 [Opitutaceae bacterium]|nr:hypothetical protein [Opitutaceae bacterium]
MNPSSLLFAGEVLDGRDEAHALIKLRDGATPVVRVRILPARHLTTPATGYLDLRDIGRESEMLELVVQRSTPDGKGFDAVDAAFIDSLTDESHARLVALADELNFSRAVSQAERQIATGTQLHPLKKRLAETMLAPTRAALESWTSSLTTQISAALAGK